MQKWLISPRDPMIFRDGKPFTTAPGSRAETMAMPFPSTLAGAVRTLVGPDPATGTFNSARIKYLLEKQIYAPLSVELDQNEQIIKYFLPAPADAVLFKTSDPDKAERYKLLPLDIGANFADLKDLKICGPIEIIKEKPHSKPPTFWDWDHFYKWIAGPIDKDTPDLKELGTQGLTKEVRTHVRIEGQTQVADDGGLFQTSGLEFNVLDKEPEQHYHLQECHRFGLLVLSDGDLSAGTNFLGGESRIVQWHKVKDNPLPFETCPEPIRQDILKNGTCRLILITPADFKKGYLPTWLIDQFGVKVEAVLNHRYEGVSGWDYEKKQAKPTRKLMPAGSVLFLRIPGEKRDQFIRDVWFKTISDDDQARQDGFGLALLGVWDGKLRKMNMEVKS